MRGQEEDTGEKVNLEKESGSLPDPVALTSPPPPTPPIPLYEKVCPWFPKEGSLNLKTWSKVGERLQGYYDVHGPSKVLVDTFSLWNLIRDSIDPRHEGLRREC